MKTRIPITVLMLAAIASATTYYVDPAGSNANNGLSPQTAWRTLLKVGISSFQPGDQILFKRDAVWNEWLTPPSSGATGNPIKFDAYGNGKPPEFSGLYQTTTANWTSVSGSVWQAALSGTQAIAQLKFVQFGTIWGNAQTALNLLTHDRDWYYDASTQNLYVFASGGNPVTQYGSVNPIILSGQSLINLNGVSWLEIQHIKLNWFDGYGVQVQGASDHIWLANMLADSQVPNGTVPIGFYVHPTGTPGDIHLYNTDSHRNYVGYRFDGSASAIELKNCRGFVNRTYGLMDNTGAVTYSDCHFYANNIATGISTDITGTAIDGGGNQPADTAPNVRGFLRYPARITVSYDDPGLINGSHQFIQSLLPTFQAKAVPLSIAVVTGYDLSEQLATTFQSWIDGGWDVNSHSVSHQYFTLPNGFTLQYTGTAASSVTLSIANKQLTITAPGDPNAQVNWDLTSSGTDLVPSGLDTLGGIVFTLNQRGVFSVSTDPNMKSAVKSEDLADVTAQDIKSAPYTLTMDKPRLMADELGWAKKWMNANLVGLGGQHSVTLNWNPPSSGPTPSSYRVYRGTISSGPYTLQAEVLQPQYVDRAVNPQQTWFYVTTSVANGAESGFSNEVSATVPGQWVYVYPGSFEDSSTETIAVAAGYAGARGSASMQPAPNAATVLGSGVNIQNILSQGVVPNLQNLSDAQLTNKVKALVFKAGVWGVPIGIFFHMNELSPHQVGVMLDALKGSGATLMTNTQLVEYLSGTLQNAGTTYFADAATGNSPDFRPSVTSVTTDEGASVGEEFKYDLMGVDQTQFGAAWDVGAFVFVPEILGRVRP